MSSHGTDGLSQGMALEFKEMLSPRLTPQLSCLGESYDVKRRKQSSWTLVTQISLDQELVLRQSLGKWGIGI